MHKIYHVSDPHISGGFEGSGLGILYSNSYFLTGIVWNWSPRIDKSEVHTMQFTDIKHYIPLIRGILNKHVSKYLRFFNDNFCFKIVNLLYWLGFLMTTLASKPSYFRKNIYF